VAQRLHRGRDRRLGGSARDPGVRLRSRRSSACRNLGGEGHAAGRTTCVALVLAANGRPADPRLGSPRRHHPVRRAQIRHRQDQRRRLLPKPQRRRVPGLPQTRRDGPPAPEATRQTPTRSRPRSAVNEFQARDTRHGARRQLDERFATVSATDSAASADTLLRKGGLGTGICSPLR